MHKTFNDKTGRDPDQPHTWTTSIRSLTFVPDRLVNLPVDLEVIVQGQCVCLGGHVCRGSGGMGGQKGL